MFSQILDKKYSCLKKIISKKMDKNIIIQTIGGVAKEETLFTLSRCIMSNTFVLENDEPYPGYHGKNLPTEAKPISIFLMTKKKYSMERILRLSNTIKKYYDHPFDAVSGAICINNDVYNCIRLRGLENYEHVEPIQKYFFSEGVKFMKKKVLKASAIIQLKKHFTIQEIDHGIYKDLEDETSYYITIPLQLSWQLFAQITFTIKNNIPKEKVNFDAGLAAIYTREILDVVRIYAHGIDIDTLKMLKEKYKEEIEKYNYRK